ncbi:hypothetical protein [Dactylosporangium sp. CA-139066]|uniref:hypothetical protein n=1 Tax=Dactylosporangium sp. CA-139066 TaxID=3239930 RepID=UPI003D90CD20
MRWFRRTADGDGTVRILDATATAAPRRIVVRLRISNVGPTRAVYAIELSDPTTDMGHRGVTVPLDGGATTTVSIDVDAGGWQAGQHTITATLSSDLAGNALATDTTIIQISP